MTLSYHYFPERITLGSFKRVWNFRTHIFSNLSKIKLKKGFLLNYRLNVSGLHLLGYDTSKKQASLYDQESECIYSCGVMCMVCCTRQQPKIRFQDLLSCRGRCKSSSSVSTHRMAIIFLLSEQLDSGPRGHVIPISNSEALKDCFFQNQDYMASGT